MMEELMMFILKYWLRILIAIIVIGGTIYLAIK